MRFLSLAARLAVAPALLLSQVSLVAGIHYHTPGMEVGPINAQLLQDTILLGKNGTNGWGTFQQLIDHNTPSLGTFPQRYWYGTQFWNGTGSPIVLVNPGEQSAERFNTSYTSKARLAGRIAERIGGAVIIMEHRYWGTSSPYDLLTEEALQYLTLDNSLKDLNYFAQNFDAPWDNAGSVAPDKVPWFFTGGSYSGALAGWLAHLYPGTFWGVHGSSGVVQAVGDYWEYFVPVEEATPRNCSKDQSAVMEYIDTVLTKGSPEQKKKLKAKFMLQDLEDADFGQAVEYGPWQLQSTQFHSIKSTGKNLYHQFCNYVENVFPNATNAVIPGPEGVGACKALKGYAKWFTEVYLPGFCEGFGYEEWKGRYSTQCFQNLDVNNVQYKDLTLDNPVNRQWVWMLCNEPFGYWQTGAPKDRPTIVSRLADLAYWKKQCPLYFPKQTYGYARGKTEETLNAWTGGWHVTNVTTRLMYANHQFDPWRDSTVSSISRPGGPMQSQGNITVRVLEGGTHCSDLYGPNWEVNAGAERMAEEQVRQIEGWVKEFKAWRAERERGDGQGEGGGHRWRVSE